MQDIGSKPQQEVEDSSTAGEGMEVEISMADAQAIEDAYQEDFDLLGQNVPDEAMNEDEDGSPQPPVEPGLAGFGPSMRGTLAQIKAGPSTLGEDPYLLLKRNYDAAVAKRKAAEAAEVAVTITPKPIAKHTCKRDASNSPVGRAPVLKKTRAAEFPFHDTMKSTRPRKCAIAIDAGGSIIGNPFGHRPGMKMSVKLDAGGLGTPSIVLNFSVSKDGTHSEDVGDDDHYHHLTVGYEPGVKISDKWMMEELHWEKAATPSDSALLKYTLPKEIQDLCTNKHDLHNLYFLTYTVNSHRATHYSDEWLYSLAGVMEDSELENVDSTMNEMMNGEETSYDVRIWFMNHRGGDNPEAIYKNCLVPLEHAVANHLRPLHQYRDDNGDAVIHLDMPTIEQVGNGMYIRNKKGGTDLTRGQVAYHSQPKKTTWDDIQEFHIYNGVSVVREHDFNRGLHAKMEGSLHRVFLEQLPIWGRSCWAGVRMTRDQDGQKDTVPPEGSIMKIDFNADPDVEGYDGQEHADQLWYGRVDARPKEFLLQAGVDFWILVSMPKHTNAGPRSFRKVHMEPDFRLPRARISVRINPSMAKRELKAIANFSNEKFAPDLLGEIRMAIMSDPSRNTDVRYRDLSWGPKGKQSQEKKDLWKALMVEYSKTRIDNLAQMALLRSPEAMRSNLVTCNCLLGTGKTRTLSDMIMALAKIGHTVLCVASANTAVDLDARTVYHALGDEGQKTLKCLRLESDGAEQAAILSKVNYGAYSGADPESNLGRAHYNEATKASNDPLMRNAVEKAAVQFAEMEAVMNHYVQLYDSMDEVYAKLQQDYRLRKSDVDVGMTLDHRIWDMTRADREAATADYAKARQMIGEVEFSRQIAAEEISEQMFDKSATYRKCVANYITNRGDIPPVQREQLEAESDKMISRVLAETTVLFTTASNAGGRLLENGATFKPTVIICDEAGQISVPSLCVPLTSFTTWEGLFLFGHPNQPQPPATAGQFNEMFPNAKMSPLALLAQKGFPGLLLDTQYRMCPGISLFPSQQFYDGKLKDHPEALKDNAVRQQMRDVSRSFGIYGPGQGGTNASASKKGIKAQRKLGDKRQGSEYLMVNVKKGTSRMEIGGTSLVNYANAYAVIGLVNRMLQQKIEPRHIKILAYFHGQKRLLQKLLDEIDSEKEVIFTPEAKAAIEISTVDSFRDREANVVIVDIVAAEDPILAKAVKAALKGKSREDPEANRMEGQEEEDNGSEGYVKTGKLTSYTRNSFRLNVALTRAKDGLVVVCQERLLCANPFARKRKHQNALMNMVSNARQRSLLLTVDDQEDLHPDTGPLIHRLGGSEAVKAKRKAQDKIDNNGKYGFIEQAKRASAELRKQRAGALIDVPTYRTLEGHTTRPLRIGDKEAADAHDRKVRQEKEMARENFKRSKVAAAELKQEEKAITAETTALRAFRDTKEDSDSDDDFVD